jgi:membrane-associated PAP2 superfamily phosphatase
VSAAQRWTELPGALLPALAFALLGMLADRSGLDLWVADRFADGLHGFPLARQWWTDHLLHDGLQWTVRIIALGLLMLVVFRRRTPLFRPALYLLVCLGAATGTVGLLKQTTHKDCPWDLQRYGGDRPYAEIGELPAADTLPPRKTEGHCFPGGHSSAAFGFFSLYFLAVRRRPAWARRTLAAVMMAGLVFAATQWVRGAHFVSHDLWSAAIGWLAAALALPILGPQTRASRSARLRQSEESAGVG